ncbi:MAG: hypothetical protein ABH803_00975 [Candidatus Micrarchaeota archaeon]
MSKFVLFLLVLSSLALAECLDLVQFSYSGSNLLLDLNAKVSPGGPAIRVLFTRPAFNFTGNFSDYFYLITEDYYYAGSKLSSFGDIYAQNTFSANVSGNPYFSKYKNSTFFYSCESGYKKSITVTALGNTSIDTNDSVSLTGNFLRLNTSEKFFVVGEDASEEILVVASTINPEIKAGSMFLKKDDGYYLAGSPYTDRYRYYYPSAFFYGCCELTCSAKSDVFVKRACDSTVFNAVDYCVDDDFLMEYSCAGSVSCVGEKISCDLGCVNGACVKPQQVTCSDSDLLDYSVLGSTKGTDERGDAFAFYDACVDGKLREYYCDLQGLPASEVVNCNCVNGVCSEVEPTIVPEEESASSSVNNWLLPAGVVLLVLFAGYYFFALSNPPKPVKPVEKAKPPFKKK